MFKDKKQILDMKQFCVLALLLVLFGIMLNGGTAVQAAPQTLDVRVADDANDVEQNGIDGSMYSNSSDLELVNDRNRGAQTIGMRFQNITVPQGATITNAYVQFVVDETNNEPTSLVIQAEAADDAAPFSQNINDVSNRPTTSASTAWNNIPAWQIVGETKQSPSVATVVQEVVNRGGWNSGNDIVITITGSGERTVESAKGGQATAPLLHIEYDIVPTPTGIVDVRVADDANDVEQNGIDGSMYSNSSDLELVNDRNRGAQTIGMRFQNITVPQGATITNAYVQFVVDETNNEPTSLVIQAEAADDATPFSQNINDVSNRPTTSASTAWNNIPAWQIVGETKQSPSVAAVVQEVVNRGGWNSGNDIVIMITGSGERTVESAKGGQATAPLLHIEYDIAPTPTSIVDVRVADDANDVEQNGINGSMYSNSSDLELVNDRNRGAQTIGMRFQNIAVPQGATITNAYLQFVVDEADSGETSLAIRAEAADDASPFTTASYNVSLRPTTSACTAWNNIPAWAVNETKQSPSVASIVQEVVNRSGWNSGNDIVITITGSGERTVESAKGGQATAPLLHIEYSTTAPQSNDDPSLCFSIHDTLNSYVNDTATNETGGPGGDFSGVAYKPYKDINNPGHLTIVDNKTKKVYQYEVGEHLVPDDIAQPEATYTFSGTDMEGIAWMYGNTYAILDENNGRIYIVDFDAAGNETNLTNFERIIETGIPEDNDGKGAEGITFERGSATNHTELNNAIFYVIKEKIERDLYRYGVGLPNAAGVSNAVELGKVVVDNAGVTDLSDLYYDTSSETVYILSHESNKVIALHNFDWANGEFEVRSDTLYLPAEFVQAEGAIFNSDGSIIVVVGETRDNGANALSYGRFLTNFIP